MGPNEAITVGPVQTITPTPVRVCAGVVSLCSPPGPILGHWTHTTGGSVYGDPVSITGQFIHALASTNPIESMIEYVRRTARNVTRWQSGEMALRWTVAGMLETERLFRRIIGYQ